MSCPSPKKLSPQRYRVKPLKQQLHKTNIFKLDILSLILKDHFELKKYMQRLIDWDMPLQKRRRAFIQLKKRLLIHLRAEEETFYVFLKGESKYLHLAGLQGQTEHEMIDRLIDEVTVAENPDVWSVRSRVLAEFLQNHLAKEERDMLPVFKKEFSREDHIYLGKQYLDLKYHYAKNRSKSAFDPLTETGFSSPQQAFYDM